MEEPRKENVLQFLIQLAEESMPWAQTPLRTLQATASIGPGGLSLFGEQTTSSICNYNHLGRGGCHIFR